MSKEYPVEMTHTTDFENYAEGFVDGGMGASRLVRQSYEAEISRLKEELEEARASASAVRKAVLEEAIEAVKAHDPEKLRQAKGIKLSRFDHAAQDEILAEERGERIAVETIVAKLQSMKERCGVMPPSEQVDQSVSEDNKL